MLLVIVFVVHSCRKAVQQTQQQINAEIAASNFPVQDAMSWFKGNKTALATKLKINSDASFLNDLSNFTPVWDSARTAVDTNYYVVEAPAKYLKKLGFNTDSSAANINGATWLLILKSKKYGSLSAALMHIHSNTGVNVSNVHYMDIPNNFSGNIFYTSLQGVSIYGYIYQNGKITKISSGKGSSKARTGPQILTALAPGECETVITDWYYQLCVNEVCGNWTYLFTTADTYCEPLDDPYHNGGGGGVPPPDDCDDGGNGGSGNIGAESVKNKLIVNTYGGGVGTPCVTCQAQADNAAIGLDAVSDNTDISISSGSTTGSDPYTRTKLYTWISVKSTIPGGWSVTSTETGTHKRGVGDNWTWVSLTHSGHHLNSATIVGTIAFDVTATNGVIENDYNAHMEMVYGSTLTIKCGDFLDVLTVNLGGGTSKSKSWYSNL